MYKILQKGRLLGIKAFMQVLLEALLQGNIIIFLTFILFPKDFNDLITIQFSALILTQLFSSFNIVGFN